MSDTIPIVVAEDHPLVRRGIRDLLQTEADMAVVGEAEDGKTAVAQVAQLQPHLVIMDLVMPKWTASKPRGASRKRSRGCRSWS